FANPVALRARFSPGLTFSGLISQVRTTVLGALEHQDIPFPALVERLHPERDAARSPIFQAMLVLQKSQLGAARGLAGLALEEPGEEAQLGELRLASWPLPHRAAQFDLSLALAETREGLSASMEYSTDLFEAATIERMLGHLRVLCEALTARPESLVTQPTLLTAEEHAQQAAWNDTTTVYEGADTLHGLVEAQCARTPEAVALRFEDETLTYRELERRANQLAHHLRGLGVGPEVRVGVCMERSLELVVALLGVLKAGGAYVPLDPSYPRERLSHMLRSSAAPVLLTQQRSEHVLPESGATRVYLEHGGASLAHLPTGAPAPLATGENLAYVIYTSGSTGLPKGAMNTHAAIRNRLLWMQRAYGLGASDLVLQKTPFSFDISVWEFFWPLLSGARLVLARPGGHQDPTYLRDIIVARGITTAHFVPSMLQSFLDEPGLERCTSLRRLVCGGEAISAELRDRCLARLPGIELHNLYGPTEAAVDVSSFTFRREDTSRTVPIGRPVGNTRLLVLDARLAPVPVGVPGELYIGGIQVGRGYLGRPELTATAFVPDPSGVEGERMYKTGDRARFLPDGNIEYLGRLDFQVKLRGLRIELGEIELTLEKHPAVRQAAVLVRDEPGGDRRLVAFLIPTGTAPTREELKDFLGTRLPAYMVPSGFGFLEALPLTPSGKLDRRALASLSVEDPSQANNWVAPRTPAEEKVAGIWSAVLGRERIGANDHFFELGGHSLLATRAVSRLRSAFGVELPLQALFEAPTVEALARRLESSALLGSVAPPLVRRSEPGPAPLSFAQERLWLVDQMVGGGPLYNMPCAVRLSGPLDVAALEHALSEVVRRHEALRTAIRAERGEPVQEVLPAVPLSLAPVELADLPESEREDRVAVLAREEALRPFDLARGPLLRAKLLRLGREHHVLLLTMHHIVSDGWSVGVLARELTALYGASTRGEPSPLAELPLQYGDYSLWQRRWLEGGELERQLGYWKRQLDALPRLQLRTDRPRPAVQSYRGRSQRFLLPRALVERLETLGRGEGTTLFMVLLGVFDVVLKRYSGQDDLVVGTDVANRNRPEIEGLIGFFTNQLVLRADLSGDPSFRELLARLRRVTLEAYEHQDVPFERLVRALRPERDAAMSPLFQVKLVLQNAPAPSLALPGLSPSLIDADGGETARWDLLLDLSPGEAGLWARAEYSTDLFDEATIARLWEHFLLAAEGVAADPGRRISATPLVTAAERERMDQWNDTGTDYPRQATVHGLFEAQAAATPDAVAVTFEGQQLTYAELDRRANQLAHHLLSLGVSPGGRVGLCLERSVEMVVGLLGILKAGCAYLPLDPSYPVERLGYLIQDGRLLALVTRSELADELPAQWVPVVSVDEDADALASQPVTAPALPVTAGHEAYVLYTSGSTGTPKGVAVPHRAIVRLVRDTTYAHFGPDETVLQFAPLAFDASTLELWGALLNGGRLAVFPPHMPSLEELGGFIARNGITTMWLTAGLFHQLVDHALEALAPVRQLLAGGDVLSPSHVQRVVDRYPGCRVINGYGPTENTTFTCCYPVPVGERLTGSVPIGRPISNTRVYVLDAAMAPVPVGAPGELYTGGDGLAHGYLNAP
ncbi:MAG TPA: amino acid adenylation domain-containing protein, partial [Archangium sp.]|uniref:amino acid adenylation domain-containing protein n=1 Tax=Archangium sp. TaxID=1872627 RepID=UPI002ED8357F